MKKIIALGIAMISVAGVSMNVHSEEFDQSKLYAGGGIAMNTSGGFTSGGESAFGFQGFMGYDLSDKKYLGDEIGLAAELGYTNSGEFTFGSCGVVFGCAKYTFDGLWVNAVADFKINEKYKFINRLGMDFGDSDGVMMGMGIQYKFDEKISARGEVVMRGGFKSYQLNALYNF